MPHVLTSNSKIHCTHGGTVVLTAAAGKLRVGTSSVLRGADVANKTIVGCTNTAPGQVPCTAVSTVDSGLAGKLRVGGDPVLLETLAGTTNGSVRPLQPQPEVGQSKLSST